MTDGLTLSHLRMLEAESIHILREVAAEFQRPVMLYSIGKDSSVMVRLAQKAFYPGRIPFPLAARGYHVQIQGDDRIPRPVLRGNRRQADRPHEPGGDRGRRESVRPGNAEVLRSAEDPGVARRACEGQFDAAFGGARRDEEKSRAKERVYSFRDCHGQWDPKNQRPELWNLFNSRLNPGESIRVFPLSNWTELDVWQYIHLENIPIVPLYFAKEREMVVRGDDADSGGGRHSADARRTKTRW